MVVPVSSPLLIQQPQIVFVPQQYIVPTTMNVNVHFPTISNLICDKLDQYPDVGISFTDSNDYNDFGQSCVHTPLLENVFEATS